MTTGLLRFTGVVGLLPHEPMSMQLSDIMIEVLGSRASSQAPRKRSTQNTAGEPDLGVFFLVIFTPFSSGAANTSRNRMALQRKNTGKMEMPQQKWNNMTLLMWGKMATCCNSTMRGTRRTRMRDMTTGQWKSTKKKRRKWQNLLDLY